MSYSLGALNAYTEQNAAELLVKSVIEPRTISLINKMPGIKSAETLNVLDTDLVFQLDACGWSTSGVTSFTQRTLTVGKIKVQEDICPRDLEAYYTQQALSPGSWYDSIPYEGQYAGLKMAKLQEALEIATWQGDTADSNKNNKRFDGLLKLIDALTASAGGAKTACAANTAVLSASNVIAKFQEMFTNIPSALLNKGNFVFFCGWDVFRMYINALTTANLYHYDANGAMSNGEIVIIGTNIRLIAVHGLDLANHNDAQSSTIQRVIGARLSNLYFGTDLLGEENRYEIFYAKEAELVRFAAHFKAGFQYAFGFEMVQYGVAGA